MNEHICANCQHFCQEFPSWHMGYCNHEDGPRYNDVMNRDDKCKAWEEQEDGTV